MQTRWQQVAEVNPDDHQQLQVGLFFKLWISMDLAADKTWDLSPITDSSRPLFLSYHLKGVCN